jgi:hypothetical protein
MFYPSTLAASSSNAFLEDKGYGIGLSDRLGSK